jgi:hypothetical protein
LRVDGWSNTATITRGYGVFIDNLVGSTTYGIYQNGDTTRNFFDGPIALGVDTLGTSSALEISSTTKALVVSRMNTTQRNNMTAAAGMIIFNTTDSKFQGYDGSGWVDLN